MIKSCNKIKGKTLESKNQIVCRSHSKLKYKVKLNKDKPRRNRRIQKARHVKIMFKKITFTFCTTFILILQLSWFFLYMKYRLSLSASCVATLLLHPHLSLVKIGYFILKR